MPDDSQHEASPTPAEGLECQVEGLTALTRTLEERAFDLYTICQVGKAFSGNDPVHIAEVLVSAMADRVGAERAVVLLRDGHEDAFRPACTLGLEMESLQEVVYRPREGILWALMKAGEPFHVRDFEGNHVFPRDFDHCGLGRLESSYWIPLRTKDHLLGVVTLDCASHSEAEARFFHLLAAQGAVALENARLYLELQESRRELKYQMNKLAMLYNVGRALNVIDDRNRLLTEILGRAAEIAEAEKGSIMLFDEGTDELVVHVVKGIDPVTEEKILNGEIQCKRLRRGEGIAGQVAALGEPMVVNDVREGSAFVDSNTSRVSSILCVPLRVHADVIGVLNITNKKAGKVFSEDDLEIVQQVADQAAVAIHNARLYELAVTDSLTRLFIRRHLFQRLSEELRRARRYGHPVAVLMLDIDHFKTVNDTYGHPFGDKVLVEVGRILRRCTRETDLVGRYGGEEFCVVLPETDALGGRTVAERVRRQMEESPFQWEGQEVRVTISGGLAGFPEHASTLEAVIQAADTALYQSKKGGRNQVTLYSGERLDGDVGELPQEVDPFGEGDRPAAPPSEDDAESMEGDLLGLVDEARTDEYALPNPGDVRGPVSPRP